MRRAWSSSTNVKLTSTASSANKCFAMLIASEYTRGSIIVILCVFALAVLSCARLVFVVAD